MTEFVTVSKNNGISTVVINNPPLNLLNNHVLKQLKDAFTRLKEDRETVSIILTGMGDRVFSVGSDVKKFYDQDVMIEEEVDHHQVFKLIEDIPKPTIALLNGYTLGGGLELALTCDIRIAESHIEIGLPEVNLGLLPGGGGTKRLPQLIGPAKAKELMFTGESLSAEESHKMGIVNQVVAKGHGMQEASKLAEKFASKSLQALGRIKELVNRVHEMPFEESVDFEKQTFDSLLITQDAKEGIHAFIEKRKPHFKHC